jgi:hypothetical protein
MTSQKMAFFIATAMITSNLKVFEGLPNKL